MDIKYTFSQRVTLFTQSLDTAWRLSEHSLLVCTDNLFLGAIAMSPKTLPTIHPLPREGVFAAVPRPSTSIPDSVARPTSGPCRRCRFPKTLPFPRAAAARASISTRQPAAHSPSGCRRSICRIAAHPGPHRHRHPVASHLAAAARTTAWPVAGLSVAAAGGREQSQPRADRTPGHLTRPTGATGRAGALLGSPPTRSGRPCRKRRAASPDPRIATIQGSPDRPARPGQRALRQPWRRPLICF